MINLIHKSLYRMSLDFSNLAKPITTIGEKNFKIQSKQPIDGYMSKNSNQNMHTVIMIHQWWGFNKSITQTAEIFSNNNIRVFVPDLYRGGVAVDAEDAGHKMDNLNWPRALEDIQAIKENLEKDSKSISVVGFCMGGALAFASVAKIQGFKIGGVFYGIPDLNIFRLDRINSKVIAHFGKQDPLKGFSDFETAQQLANDAKKNGYPIDVRIYDEASHAFSNQDSKYFNQQVRDKAFKATKQLIEAN